MTIGISKDSYAYRRLVCATSDVKTKSIRLNNLYFWFRLPQLILLRLGIIKRTTEILCKLYYEFFPIFPKQCDIFHLYTSVNFSNSGNWVLSIEHCIPYNDAITKIIDSPDADFSRIQGNKYIEKVLYRCSQPNCRHIIALSECAKTIQSKILEQFPDYQNTIEHKITVLHPSQKLCINDLSEKGLTYADDEVFSFFYVGNHFYRKGGREILEVLSQLRNRFKFELYLVGDASKASFNAPMLGDDDIRNALQIIENNKDWIHYFVSLPNSEVLNLAKRSHVALLPTWSDSFGFSVLECQACGTPVITTDIRALPEINNNNLGWLINVPTNPIGHPIIVTQKEKEQFHKCLVEGLYSHCEHVLTHRKEIQKKAKLCLQHIVQNYSEGNYQRIILSIYESSIK